MYFCVGHILRALPRANCFKLRSGNYWCHWKMFIFKFLSVFNWLKDDNFFVTKFSVSVHQLILRARNRFIIIRVMMSAIHHWLVSQSSASATSTNAEQSITNSSKNNLSNLDKTGRKKLVEKNWSKLIELFRWIGNNS